VRAIVRSADLAPAAAAGLVVVRAGSVAALATACAKAPAPSETELRAHEAITQRIHENRASLPSRFGELFADEDALAEVLRDRADSLAQSLDSFGSRVELAITLAWRTKREVRTQTMHEVRFPEAGAGSGRVFLEAAAARERERREAEQVVARLVEQLPCERAFIRHRMCPRDGIAATVAILCARDEVTMLRRAVDSFGERSSEVSASVHGPLPPYSFAT
jgi:hypothetical protein